MEAFYIYFSISLSASFFFYVFFTLPCRRAPGEDFFVLHTKQHSIYLQFDLDKYFNTIIQHKHLSKMYNSKGLWQDRLSLRQPKFLHFWLNSQSSVLCGYEAVLHDKTVKS